MLEYIHSLQGLALTWFGGLFALMTAFRMVTKNADQELGADVRDSIAIMLLDLKPRMPGEWIQGFNRIFDLVFGEEHFRWRCFGISMLISVVFYLFFFWIYVGVLDVEFDERDSWFYFGVAPLFAIMCNGLVDYISLLETRWILGTRIPYLGKFIVDIALTLIITFFWAVVFLFVFSRNSLSDSIYLVLHLAERDIKDQVLVLSVFTTSFTTSFWLWMHGLAQFIIRLINGSVWMVQKLNIEAAPVRALGIVINANILLLGSLCFLVYILFESVAHLLGGLF
ncbi:MAG: hypothetical protein CMK89_12110 [Pseudomonadales bacterium]|nr:hypothetical protein [Pseudomonadales bacterium]